jgi:hypothetical protein
MISMPIIGVAMAAARVVWPTPPASMRQPLPGGMPIVPTGPWVLRSRGQAPLVHSLLVRLEHDRNPRH